jgi:hypothetical protein
MGRVIRRGAHARRLRSRGRQGGSHGHDARRPYDDRFGAVSAGGRSGRLVAGIAQVVHDPVVDARCRRPPNTSSDALGSELCRTRPLASNPCQSIRPWSSAWLPSAPWNWLPGSGSGVLATDTADAGCGANKTEQATSTARQSILGCRLIGAIILVARSLRPNAQPTSKVRASLLPSRPERKA